MAIPVILDTDIGTDIDDTWALCFLSSCPELDLQLVTTCTGDTRYRVLLVAKILETLGMGHVPIALGPRESSNWGPQAAFVHDYSIEDYPGLVMDDAAGSIVDTIQSSKHHPVTILGIGPLGNIASALEKDPTITEHARYVGMQGSLRKGYGGTPAPSIEYNVAKNPVSCRKVFNAGWDVTITPLDTCGTVRLEGPRYVKIIEADTPACSILIENQEIWSWSTNARSRLDPAVVTSTLFDTVAVCLCFTERFFTMETVGISVGNDGFTAIDPESTISVRCATKWRDQGGFLDLMVDRLSS